MRLFESQFDSGHSSSTDTELQFSRNLIEAAKAQTNRCFSPQLADEENAMRRNELIKSMFPNVPDATMRYGHLIPKNIPLVVNIMKNFEDASHMTPEEFFKSVRGKGKWDYKQLGSQYQEFGNWAFAIESSGFSRGFLPHELFKRGAGWAQEQAGTTKDEWGHWWGGGSFGDDPFDQKAIENGFEAIRESLRLREPKNDSQNDGLIFNETPVEIRLKLN